MKHRINHIVSSSTGRPDTASEPLAGRQELACRFERQDSPDVSAVVRSLEAKLEQIRQSELHHFRNRISGKHAREVDELSRGLIEDFLHYIVAYLRANPDKEEQVARMLRSMFQLGDE